MLVLGIVLGVLVAIQVANRFAYALPDCVACVVRWIHAMLFEGIAIVAIFILHPIRFLPSHRRGMGVDRGQPILLIHGYLHDSSAWVYHRRKLARAGFGPVYVMSLGNPFRSIREHARAVQQKAEQIEKETARNDLILIGHSMGGLVSAWWATQIAPPKKVTDLITIGSPLGGTILARIGLGRCAREMERGSRLLTDLQREMQRNSIRYYHIATKTDQLVIPYRSALIAGHPQYVLEDIGHVSLLFSPRVARKICAWIRA